MRACEIIYNRECYQKIAGS